MTERAVPDWLTNHTFAHRGHHSFGVPENSMAAMEAAIASGFGIECDIQMSRDSVPMVFHDWDLDRLTSARGRVADKRAAELCELSLGETDQRIWSLSDLLQLVDGRVPILIEVKSMPHFGIQEACAAIAKIIGAYFGPLAVMSFDPRMGEWFAKHAPQYTRGLVCTDTLDHGFKSLWRQPHALERAKPDFLACDIRDLPNTFCELWRKNDQPLLTWTVRTPELRKKALSITDAQIAEGDGIV
ncbi:MAG: glycerophosphodiester phosphodiesterase family protein [Pseudomonadota bacterium]